MSVGNAPFADATDTSIICASRILQAHRTEVIEDGDEGPRRLSWEIRGRYEVLENDTYACWALRGMTLRWSNFSAV